MREHRDEHTFPHFQRFGKHLRGSGWYSFDCGGMHFIGVVDVLHGDGGGFGSLGFEQLKWLEADVSGLPRGTPVVVFTYILSASVDPIWGWGTAEAAPALDCLERFESVFVLDGQIH